MSGATSKMQFIPGMVLALTSCVVIVIGRQYSIGNLTAMGPGFLPVALGVLLLVLAVLVLVGEQRSQVQFKAPLVPLLPLLLASTSLLSWALLVEYAGFVPAAIAQLTLASLATRHQYWRGVVISILVISALSYLLFVGMLGLPIRAFGG